jgi:hypothetical protein
LRDRSGRAGQRYHSTASAKLDSQPADTIEPATRHQRADIRAYNRAHRRADQPANRHAAANAQP